MITGRLVSSDRSPFGPISHIVSVTGRGHARNFSTELPDGPCSDHGEGHLKRLDHINGDCPDDVVDRVLWRNAQSILEHHSIHVDGACRACGRRSPCSPRRLAERAAAAARRPWHEAWTARNDMSGIMPMLQPSFVGAHNWRRRNQREFDR